MSQNGPDSEYFWTQGDAILHMNDGHPQGVASTGIWWRVVVKIADDTTKLSGLAALGPASPSPSGGTVTESVWVSDAELADAKAAADTSMAALNGWWSTVSSPARDWWDSLTNGQRADAKALISACRP